jgi:hypothetical protein
MTAGFNDLTTSLSGLSGTNNLVFPDNLNQIDHWMVFRVNKPELRRKADFETANDIARIFLPLPDNLGTQYSQSYSNEAIGLAGVAGAQSGTDMMNVIDNSKDFKSFVNNVGAAGTAIKDGFKGGTGYYGAQALSEAGTAVGAAIGGSIGGTIGAIGGGIGGTIGGQFVKGAIAGQGVAINPFMATLYTAPEMRTHQFSWKLVPKNPKESTRLKDIIEAFKFHSAPDMTGTNSTFFQYPEQFDIDFHYDEYLYNIAPSVCTSFEVNYHGEGRAMYHEISQGDETAGTQTTKAPVSVTINATFQEVAIITKKEISQFNR